MADVEKIRAAMPDDGFHDLYSLGPAAFIVGAIASGGALARAIREPIISIRVIVSEMLVATFTAFILITALTSLGMPGTPAACTAAAIGMMGERGYLFLVSLCKALVNTFLKALGGSIDGKDS